MKRKQAHLFCALIAFSLASTQAVRSNDLTALRDDWDDVAWAGLELNHVQLWPKVRFDKLVDFLLQGVIVRYEATSPTSKTLTLPSGDWFHLRLIEDNPLHQFVLFEISEMSPGAITPGFVVPVLFFVQVHPWIGKPKDMSVLKIGYKIQGNVADETVLQQAKGVLSAMIRKCHDRVRTNMGAYPCSEEFRTYGGTCNNAENSGWGAYSQPLKRLGDGTLDPAFIYGTNDYPSDGMPNPRTVSQTLFRQETSIPSKRKVTALAVFWGQFIDHDVGLTPESKHTVFEERMDIDITDKNDPLYARHSGSLEFTRSLGVLDGVPCCGNGIGERFPREQGNIQSSYIDASHIYGCERDRVTALRAWEDGTLQTGQMSANGEYLLPLNSMDEVGMKLGNAATDSGDHFVAGDVRANEQPVLTSLHTLFMREHNRVAAVLKSKFDCWAEEKVFQYARKIIASQIQLITYQQFLPAILGKRHGLPAYDEYKSDVDPSLANFFSACAFRFGHSMVPGSLSLRVSSEQAHPRDGVMLHDVFFEPSFVKEVGIEPILLGSSYQVAETVDTKVVSSLQSDLFKSLTGGIDLVSLNIQRGRDHGVPKYNDARELYGLDRKSSFAQVTSDAAVEKLLAELYGSVDEMDSFVGGLAENHLQDSELGELFHTAVREQFIRLRDGDRFFYRALKWPKELLNLKEVKEIRDGTLTLQAIILRNGGGTLLPEHFPVNVFQMM